MHFDIWRSPAADELQIVESNLHRFVTPPHVHPFLELIWLRSGTAVINCRGQPRVVRAAGAQRYFPALARALRHWHLGGKARSETVELLDRLLLCTRGCPGTTARQNLSLHPAVVKVKAILEHNAGGRVELPELAREVNLNERYLISLFKRASGISPCQFQLGVRAERARNLIVADRPLADVAMSTGFADQSHLNRDFKKFFGVTPSAFRKACTIYADG